MNDERNGANDDARSGMSDDPSQRPPYEHCCEVYGVPVALGASDAEILARLVALLPAGAVPCERDIVERRFAVWKHDESGWRYDGGYGPSPIMTDLTLAIGIVDTVLRLYVGTRAPERIFVHAGVVAHRGRAIVIPGHSLSGKSTLVAALVRAGAVYYSDEYAILDDQGMVHPYDRPLSIREPDSESVTLRPVASFGGTAGVEPVPVGLIAATKYRPEASWSPERRSAGEGMLALLAHVLPARERPAAALAAARRAASTALFLEGERGEADVTAQALMEIAAEAFPNGAGPQE